MLTLPLEPRAGSALDPLIEEVTWRAWRIVAADPQLVNSQSRAAAAATIFAHLIEILWAPGRVSIITELRVEPDRGTPHLEAVFAIGILGSATGTAFESAAAAQIVRAQFSRPWIPYEIAEVDPSELLHPDPAGLAHTALIRQRAVSFDRADGTEASILSRWNPVLDPWGPLAHLLATSSQSVRVRATVLPTEMTVSDRLSLDHSLRQVSDDQVADELAGNGFALERARATLVDIKASFATPLLCAEVAITSSAPVADVFARAVGSRFTSEVDVVRREGASVVAGQKLMLGGFEIERNPEGLRTALTTGLPLRGGVGSRELRDLCTLYESPIGWPIPAGQPIPSIATRIARALPAPAELREGVPLGVAGTDEVRLPSSRRDRHVLLVGTSGCGKTTAMIRAAVDDLRSGRGLLYIDPHGAAADILAGVARDSGIDALIIDADPASARIMPYPSLRTSGLDATTASAKRFCDAIASSLPDQSWTGPRWHHMAGAIVLLSAAHGVHLDEALSWVQDANELKRALADPMVPAAAVRALADLHGRSFDDSASLRDWILCKFDPLTQGPAARLLGPPGQGVDLGDALRGRDPVILNLSALPVRSANLVGHLALSTVLDEALSRGAVEPGAEPYGCYVDEVHRFPVQSLERFIAEGRKFGVSLTLATQGLGQLKGWLADAAIGVGVKVAFRQTPESAHALAPLLDLEAVDLTGQPDMHAFVKVGELPTFTLSVPSLADEPVTSEPSKRGTRSALFADDEEAKGRSAARPRKPRRGP